MTDVARVACVILNFRTPERSVETAHRIGQQVDYLVLVENGSGDSSADLFRNAFGESRPVPVPDGTAWVSDSRAVVVLGENHGYSEGNNVGLRTALALWNPTHLFVLNPDAMVPGPALARAVALTARPRVGAVGILPPPPPGLRRQTRRKYLGLIPTHRRALAADVYEVFPICGFACLITRSCLQDLEARRGGFFRSDLFFLTEEFEVGWTLHGHDWKVLALWDSGVEHAGQESRKHVRAPISDYYENRNLLLLARGLPLLRGFWVGFWAITWSLGELMLRLVRGNPSRARAVAEGLRDGLLNRAGKWPRQA